MRHMAKEKIVKTNRFLRADQMSALCKMSAQTDVPVARPIRRSIESSPAEGLNSLCRDQKSSPLN
jgi:hypothetical protein